MKNNVLSSIFLFVSVILTTLILVDSYWIKPSIKLDVFKNIHIENRTKSRNSRQWDYLITQSGEKIRIPDHAGIYFEYQVPITIYKSGLFHQPLYVEFRSAGKDYHLSASLKIEKGVSISVLIILVIVQIIIAIKLLQKKKVSGRLLVSFIMLTLIFASYFFRWPFEQTFLFL